MHTRLGAAVTIKPSISCLFFPILGERKRSKSFLLCHHDGGDEGSGASLIYLVTDLMIVSGGRGVLTHSTRPFPSQSKVIKTHL